MRRTKPRQATHTTKTVQIPDNVLLQMIANDSYLVVNKHLLKKYGPSKAIFLGNLIDKYKFFKERGKSKDGWFFQTHEHQIEATGMSEWQLRKIKKEFKDESIIETKMEGMPAKEWYKLNLKLLTRILFEDHFRGKESQRARGKESQRARGKESQRTSPTKNRTPIKENKYKENKDKENKNTYAETDVSAGDGKKDTDNTTSTNSGKGNNSTKEKKKDPFTAKAAKLAQIYFDEYAIPKLNVPKGGTNFWQVVGCIRNLLKKNRYAPGRIEEALHWIAEHYGERGVPEITTPKDLEYKFLKIEAAMKRKPFHTDPKKNRVGTRNLPEIKNPKYDDGEELIIQ
jgi:hypothetical protein